MTRQYEAIKYSARIFIVVVNGQVTRAESPTHECFAAPFVGDPWPQVREALEADGFQVHGGA